MSDADVGDPLVVCAWVLGAVSFTHISSFGYCGVLRCTGCRAVEVVYGLTSAGGVVVGGFGVGVAEGGGVADGGGGPEGAVGRAVERG